MSNEKSRTGSEPQSARWSEYHVEQLMGNLLRTGVLLSAAVVTIGGVLYLSRHGRALPEYEKFRGVPQDLRTLGGVLNWDHWQSGREIIQLGLLLLIATPVARVAFAVVAFLRARDRLYVVVSLIVLSLLGISLFSALGP